MLLSFLLIALSTYFLTALFNTLAYFFVIFLGLVILNIEVLSLFKAISTPQILILNLLTFLITLALWVKKGKPLLKPDFKILKTGFRKIKNSLKLDKGLAILCLGVIVVTFTGFMLACFLPVNDFDALEYHTYRALVWTGKGYIHHFETLDVRNLVMPINSEIIYTWIYTLTKKDIGFGLLEFSSFVFGIFGIWIFLERFKYSFRKRLWAICIYTSFAGVISQISSTQTDLLVGVLLLYSMIFFYDYINQNKLSRGFFSSLSFAIALGVKSTAFIAGLPLLILFLVYSFIKYKKEGIKKFAAFIGFLGLNFIIFSSYNYFLNFIDYSNPFGSKMALNRHAFFGGTKGYVANFIRYNIQMFDFAGFMWGIYLSEPVFNLQNKLFSLLNIANDTGVIMKMEGLNSSLSEQTIGFGITGFLVFIPSVLFGIFNLIKNGTRKAKIKERYLIIYSLGLLFYLCLGTLSFALGYMVYSIRFICAFVVITSPVIILSYFKKNNFYKGLVVFFACFYLFIASGHMAARPFYKLLESYKTEKNYETFIDNVRCMNYQYFKGDRAGCKTDKAIIPYLEKNKNIGIFADAHILMHIAKISAAKKETSIEELIVPRIDSYDLAKYDYLITAHPGQALTEFNNKDKETFKAGKYPKECMFIEDKISKRISQTDCFIPYKKLEEKNFKPLYKIETNWIDTDDKNVYARYILWRNMK